MTTPQQRGLILYGPPASGKDTITAAVADSNPRYTLYRRLKVGPGRTTGYRLGTAADLVALARKPGEVLYMNERYGATYVIDRGELTRILDAGLIPVVHLGQAAAVDTITAATPSISWVTVDLQCPRDVAERRIQARDTGDTAERLDAWDQTPPLPHPTLSIDTSTTQPDGAARLIAAASDPDSWDVVVPVLNLVSPTGAIDWDTTRRYATRAAATWVDRVLVNGSTTRGDLLDPETRAAVLDLWIAVLGPERVLSCSWEPADLSAAAARGVTPMAVLHNLDSSALDFLRGLPAGATIYTHPMYGCTFTAELAAAAAAARCLPAGGKLAKVGLSEIAEIRRAAPEFKTWDGSARHLQESVEAGATGIVATPLAAELANPDHLPPKEFGVIQAVLDRVQRELDRLPDRPARRDALLGRLRAYLPL